MRDCLSCKWDALNQHLQGQRMIQCKQGHIRTFQKIIEDCHAWEVKKTCWCELSNHSASVQGYNGDGPLKYFKPIFCPQCGKKLEQKCSIS